jgi:multidrug transporter EmrE-like cation transporter
MSPASLALILVTVTISALAQIGLKVGMSSAAVQSATASSSGILYAAAQNPMVLGGLALYGLGALGWLLVLARVDVGQAYPFMGLSIVLTFSMGHFLLQEPFSAFRIAGMLLVVAGVGLVAQN